eukprot:SM000069S20701  [mRNA]  locus=s69:373490:377091:+ [translate_table: standard]
MVRTDKDRSLDLRQELRSGLVVLALLTVAAPLLRLQGPTTTIGVYIDAGSIYESPGISGTSHLIERMAFKSTANRTHFRLIRELEAIGGNVVATAAREQMAFTGDALKTFLPELVELIADSVRNPLFLDWEVKEQIAKVRAEIQEAATNAQSLVLEALHTVGYTGALAKPLLAPESNLGRLDSQVLHDFVTENFTAPRMVLAASGADHEELLSLAEPLFSDLPSSTVASPPTSKYVGGDWRQASDQQLNHLALGFEFPGGWRNEKEAIAISVLQTLLGGGGSFSAGGPGKGMYTRLYTRVLNEYSQVHSCTAFSSIYNDTGIFGIHATARPDFIGNVVDIITREFQAVASPNGVTKEELARAKKATISGVLMNLESRVVIAEDMGRQILTYGHRKSAEDFVQAVEAVTLEELQAIAQKILKTPLSMASYGDAANVQRYDHVAARFS